VRELQNLIERAVIRSNDGVLPNPLPAVENNPVTLFPKQGTLTDSTRASILQALRASGWVVAGPGGAAARLGLKRTTLIAKMKKLGISRPVPISNDSQFGEDENSGLAL
jgi:transcriptional regulator of acetoin/glycerol metabolism